MLIDEFLESKRMRNKSPNTLKNYKRDLKNFNAYIQKYNTSLNDLNDLIVQQYLNTLKNNYSPATINRIYAAIRSFCHYSNQLHAVDDIEIQRVPHISKQESKGLDKEEVTKLRLSVANDKSSPTRERDQAIIDFLLYTGCRVSELVNCNRDDITYHKGIYTVHINESKTNQARKVFVDAKQFKYIKRYLDHRTDDNEALFTSRRGRISVRMVQTILNKYGINPHLLRHTYCSILARNNVDLTTIAALVGHRDINTTRRYANPTEKEMAEAVSKAFSF
ncbi:tyrosine-type recombinase/integrase [Tuberibacillus calidus]|uniref:tyrosine-type recombinase/integrase n=1 Tax=Tuberibacillus calidus TaxID=340097 RepID=UPI000405A3AF|nr:tyrosine-type recombinase/integrase [Tuberibacillus calidus]